MQQVQLVECPRDAMQGWPVMIETKNKIRYLDALLQCGFHSIDFGSFVSPKAIPQMADTADVTESLDKKGSDTGLLAIIANLRGAEQAASYDKIGFLGFPFSVSPTFQQRNTNSSIQESLKRVEEIKKCCDKANKKLVIYLSMAFGNPYGDDYNESIVSDWALQIAGMGVGIISLADTVGVADAEQVYRLTSTVIQKIPDATIGVHLHSTAENWREKLDAAWVAGCRRFDGALKGIGGCPMAGNDLVGNMNTEWMLQYFEDKAVDTGIDKVQLKKCIGIAEEIFIS